MTGKNKSNALEIEQFYIATDIVSSKSSEIYNNLNHASLFRFSNIYTHDGVCVSVRDEK